MTWKRVATAAVLVPVVVSLVLWGSTAIVALAIALITLLALFEYFALGEAIGHRAYRFWTGTCALLLVFVQWWGVSRQAYVLPRRLPVERGIEYLFATPLTVDEVFFLFVLGIAALTRKPVPCAIGLSLAAVMMVTIAPFAALAIAGMSFRGDADCAEMTPAERAIRETSLAVKPLNIFVSSTCKLLSLEIYKDYAGPEGSAIVFSVLVNERASQLEAAAAYGSKA